MNQSTVNLNPTKTHATVHFAGYALALGALGQYLLFDAALSKSPMMWLIVMATVFGLPGAVVCLISFCNQPPFDPSKFRNYIFFALWWYAISSVLSVILYFALRSLSGAKLTLVLVALGMIFAGWLAFIPLLRVCRELHHIHILKPQTPN